MIVAIDDMGHCLFIDIYSFVDGSDVETDALFNFNQIRICHWSLLDNAQPVNPNLQIIYSHQM